MGTDVVDTKFVDTQRAYRENDPPIEIGQIWSADIEDGGTPFRRIRILAPHPDCDDKGMRRWIYENLPARMRVQIFSIGICPEFNLRYVFQLET